MTIERSVDGGGPSENLLRETEPSRRGKADETQMFTYKKRSTAQLSCFLTGTDVGTLNKITRAMELPKGVHSRMIPSTGFVSGMAFLYFSSSLSLFPSKTTV